jgi:cytochrome c peroxidase
MGNRVLPIGLLALASAAFVALIGASAVETPRAEAALAELKAQYRRPAEVPHPEDNVPNAARERLGRLLFFDPRLSGSGVLACATCHNPGFAWTDGLERAVGHAMKPLPRRTPTILNLAWAEALFWDGRAGSLEEQALGPIASPDEMNLPLEALVPKLEAIPEYAARFEEAYPGEGIEVKTIAKAIATFERTIVSGSAPFDRWIEGDEAAIGADAVRGFVLFNGKAACATCHAGWRFTDDSFHDIGVASTDRGRGAVLEGIDAVQFAFKTPTLRNVAERAPYMHDGSERALEDTIALYDQGGRVRRPSLSREIKPLDLSAEESRQLVAFLLTLTSEDAPVTIPRFPR